MEIAPRVSVNEEVIVEYEITQGDILAVLEYAAGFAHE